MTAPIIGVIGTRGGIGATSLSLMLHVGSPASIVIDANIHLPTLTRVLAPSSNGLGSDHYGPVRTSSGWLLPGVSDLGLLALVEPSHWLDALRLAETLAPPVVVLDLPPTPADPCILTLLRACTHVVCLADGTAPSRMGQPVERITRSIARDAVVTTWHRHDLKTTPTVPWVAHGVLEDPGSAAVRNAARSVIAQFSGGEGLRTPTLDPFSSLPPDLPSFAGNLLDRWRRSLRTKTWWK